MSTFDYLSADGTRIRGWTNDASGPPVVVANGLGTPPTAWPTLVARDSEFRAYTWFYRGSGGSSRPADPSRITVDDHAGDLLALMDAAGVERATIACWSMGVNIAFELAERHPDRVSGLLAVAGVPGGTFRAMFGPLKRARRLRHAASLSVAKSLRVAGPVLDKVSTAVPLNRATAWAIAHSGFMMPSATPERLIPTLEEFRRHDFRWYFTLAVAMADHDPMDLSFVRCPTTLVAGKWDIITSRHEMERAARQIPHARLVVLDGSHFLPLEQPEALTDLLRDLVHGGSST